MSTEKPTSLEIEEPKNLASAEEINQKESSSELSVKLTHINNILNIMDFSDEKEDEYREILKNKDWWDLKDLSRKSKTEIILFLISSKKKGLKIEKDKTIKTDNTETQKQNSETQKINKKIQKIKSAFPKFNFK